MKSRIKSGGSKVKRIFLLMVAMQVFNGAAFAGDLKVAVPLADYKEMEARIEALEKENSQLKQGTVIREVTLAPPVSVEMQNRLQAMESENGRLRQEINGLKGSQGSKAGSNAEVQAKLEAPSARDSNQTKDAGGRGVASISSPQEDGGLQARLDLLESDNSHLRQEVKMLQDDSLAEFFGTNKISAREQYFHVRRKTINHVFKF
ncbi:MAG: hypothetical protein HGA96_15135 [Desulfobulbaceae bacterium]|nr:hypothetical protein [Desulfobulbaceae bacterium]